VRPASFCGVVGYKASFGAVPRKGAHPVSGSLDHIGFFTKSVADARYAFNLLRNTSISEEDAIVIPELSSKPLKDVLGNHTLRIGVLKTPFDELLSQEQVETVNHAAAALEGAGAHIEPISLPQNYWDGIEALAVLMSCEAAVVHEEHLKNFPDLLSADMKELIDRGNACPVGDYIKAKNLQAELRLSIAEYFERCDAILAAPATGEAPEGLGFTGNPIFCSLWTFIGTPAIALPVGKSSNGLPLGIQLIGNYRDDEKLLNLAEFAEQCFKNEKLPA
jgi:Asp-tRNA(Asn)/Glu-tRNA(Gln) amidotransferase A subunit family amidase